jgi:iron complex outermembrane receptor protein
MTLLPRVAAGAASRPFVLKDGDGRPLADVSVSVVGRSGSVRTGADGTFVLLPPPVPPFQLIVFGPDESLLGIVRVDSLENETDRELVLVPKVSETIQVVSGVALASVAPPAAAATVLSHEELERMRAARLVESLGEIPGVSPSGPGQTAVPTLRGMARGRTLVLLDGARVTTERRAGASATYLDPFSLGYVEVVRGPGSVAYGSDALGGVIHARTVSPKAGVNGIRYEISAGAGEEYAAIGGEANLALGSGALLAQFHQRSFADYESPGGTVDNSSSRDSGGLLRGLIPLKRARFHVGLQVDRGRDISRPSADEDTARTIYPLEDSDRLTLGIDLPGWKGFTGFEVLAFLGRYRLVTERTTIDPSTSDRQLSRADVEASDASLRFVATRPVEKGYWRAGVDLVTRFGLDATNRVEDHPQGGTPVLVADEETIEEARRVDAGLFVEGERVWGRMSLAAGLRGDDVSTRNRGGFFGDRSTSDGAVSGYAAISWRFGGGMDAAVQVSRGFRDPQLSDRYFRGTTARGRIAGNPDLEPETTRQLDLALRSGKGRIRFGLYGYLYRIRELVERFEIAPGEFAFRNRGEEDVRGIELESDMDVASGLALRFTLNLARGEILDDGSDPADIPADWVAVSVLHRPVERLDWQLRLRAFARDDRPGPTEQVTPGFAVLDAFVRLSLSETLDLRLNLWNLADREYPSSADGSSPLAPGRSVALTLAGRF